MFAHLFSCFAAERRLSLIKLISRRQNGPKRIGAALLVLVVISGCGGERAVISQLRTSTPAEAAASAMENFDKDGDGKIGESELTASPALLDAVARLDANNDGELEASEIEARFQQHDSLADLVPLSVRVFSSSGPLNGATVTFTPAPFMGEGKQPYVGTTDDLGQCYPKGESVEISDLPTGFYDVHIVHAASGVDLTVGREVADDLPSARGMEFNVDNGGASAGGVDNSRGRR